LIEELNPQMNPGACCQDVELLFVFTASTKRPEPNCFWSLGKFELVE